MNFVFLCFCEHLLNASGALEEFSGSPGWEPVVLEKLLVEVKRILSCIRKIKAYNRETFLLKLAMFVRLMIE